MFVTMLKEYQIEKLRGSDNYHTWKFAVKNCLEMNDLEKCIVVNATTKVATETDEKKLKKANNVLSLSVDSSVFFF